MSAVGKGPSLEFQELVKKAASDKTIDKTEAEAIKSQLLKEAGNIQDEGQLVDFIKEAETFLKSEFTGTNVNAEFTLSDKSKELKEPTTFSFNIKGSIKKDAPPPKVEFDAKVTNYLEIDKDKQFTTLTANRANYVKYDASGNITGVSIAGKGTIKPEDAGIEAKDLKSLIMSDFSHHADLKKIPNTEEGAKLLWTALQKLPGNTPDKPSLDDAKALLSFIHTGTDGKGDAPTPFLKDKSGNIMMDANNKPMKDNSQPGPVQRLQVLLERCSGTMGEEIRGLNTPPGGDDNYGYSTTLQIRALSGALNVTNFDAPPAEEVSAEGKGELRDLIPSDRQVMIALDVTGSVKQADGSGAVSVNNYQKTVSENPTSDVGIMVYQSNAGSPNSGQVLFKPGEVDKIADKELKALGDAQTKLDKAKANVSNAQNKVDNAQAEMDAAKGRISDATTKVNEAYKKWQAELTKSPQDKNAVKIAKDEYDNAKKEKAGVAEANNVGSDGTLYKNLSKAKAGLVEAKSALKTAETEYKKAEKALNDKPGQIVKTSIQNSGGTHQESPSTAVYQAITAMNPNSKKEPYILVQGNEADHDASKMKKLLQDSLDGKLKLGDKVIDPKSIVFFNPGTKETLTLDDIIQRVTTNGKFDQAKFDKYTTGNDFAIFEENMPAKAKK